MKNLPPFLFAIIVLLINACQSGLPDEVAVEYAALPDAIDFNFHVRPILSDRCWSCHGPDAEGRKGGLRLDLKEGAFARLPETGNRAIVGGKPGKSAIVERILHGDPEMMMPPTESNLQLDAREKAILIKWIEQGAEWKAHWSLLPPVKPKLPKIENAGGNPIDQFIRYRLEREGLASSPEADRERLVRRVFLDLTGLPPPVAEIDAFLNDSRSDAYDRLVDRLLGTDAHAERLAMEWMDVARYADSHGMHADGARLMWPWRDWVIKAFSENMPYNEFITWQLAGDLLPDAGRDQKLATAFHRNHPMTAEGGVVDEEFRIKYVVDRTNTTATALLGLTMECAQCHDHKFDPVSQKEFYQLAAFFNNVRELGMTGDDGNYGPMLLLPSPETEAKLRELEAAIQAQEGKVELTAREVAARSDFVDKLPPVRTDLGLLGRYPLDELVPDMRSKNNRSLADGKRGTSVTESVDLVDGIAGKALEFNNEYDELYLEDVGLFESTDPYSAMVWINTVKREPGKTQVIMGTAGDKNNFWRGWDLFLDSSNRLSVRLIHSLPHNYLQVTSLDSIHLNTWTQVGFTYDGLGKASGLQLFIDGKPCRQQTDYDRLYKSIHTVASGAHQPVSRPIRVGKSYRAFTGENGIFKGRIDEIELYGRQLAAIEIAARYAPGQPRATLISRKEDLPPGKKEQLLEFYLQNDESYQASLRALRALQKERLAVLDTLPEVMVMEEMATPRPMHLLRRGQYDMPGERVEAGTPGHVLHFPDSLPKDRLGLAQWFFMKENPLTARVAVNRYWQMIFGKGLVDTPQDFGSQGSLPSHPELLDWLAVYFMESGWDLRSLLRLMVTSDTYRQSSAITPELQQRDPDNRLLARGPAYRLPAEMIRDNALAASGLLVRKVGGKSVKPYQPEGLWIELGNFSHELLRYRTDSGDDLYRRSLYTFIRRTSPPPFLINFDATNRDVCTVQRESTNTPLQALNLLNDPQFVEAARVLAGRVQREGGPDLESQIDLAFRLATGRRLKEKEKTVFVGMFEREYKRFQNDPGKAMELLEVGTYPVDRQLEPARTAALAIVAGTMLNHDEAYMKR